MLHGKVSAGVRIVLQAALFLIGWKTLGVLQGVESYWSVRAVVISFAVTYRVLQGVHFDWRVSAVL